MAVQLVRSFLLGRSMGDAVLAERREALDTLASHDLFYAARALTDPANARAAFNDWMKMRGVMLAGGLHRVRLTNGRSIDG